MSGSSACGRGAPEDILWQLEGQTRCLCEAPAHKKAVAVSHEDRVITLWLSAALCMRSPQVHT